MKQIAITTEYSFDSFSEMVEFLLANPNHRRIRFQETQSLILTTDNQGSVGRKADAFYIDEFPNSEDAGITPLDEYFGDNDEPLDDCFADDYCIDEFVGEEYHKL